MSQKSKSPSGIYLHFCRRTACQRSNFCSAWSKAHYTPANLHSLPVPPLAQLDIYDNMVHKDCQRCKNNVSKHNPEHTVLTKRIKGFSVSNQICQSSFPFMPAKNHISKHINNLIIPNQLFHCALTSGVPLTKRTLPCLPGLSQFIPTPPVLCFPSRILSAPSYKSLICHLLDY